MVIEYRPAVARLLDRHMRTRSNSLRRRYGYFPTIHREDRFRFSFYASDSDEPPHVHVTNSDGEAKIWIRSGLVDFANGMRDQDVRRARRIVIARRQEFLRRWDAFFANP